MNRDYRDMLAQPRPPFHRHPPMSALSRAAQFAPFAALSGYGSAVQETERLTESEVELDDTERVLLDERLQCLAAREQEHPPVTFVCFVPDKRKAGGAYVRVSGAVREFRRDEGVILLVEGTRIAIASLIRVESPILDA